MPRSGKAEAGASKILVLENTAPGSPVLFGRIIQLVIKRGIDICGALFLILSLSLVFVVLALLVRHSSPGPMLFLQQREGQGGRLFVAYKFRTVFHDRADPSGLVQPIPGDGRVTPLGLFLRRSGLDELPQLLNVLRGDMSLVGPRPHVPGMIAAGRPYRDLVPEYDRRLLMRPGITGWAQVNGLRGATFDETTARRRIEHDLAYIENFSLLFDLKIIFLTLWTGFRLRY
jgi:lipopolysaccharide/colanic/teichoic acid biosynthesis glycosyltransferase